MPLESAQNTPGPSPRVRGNRRAVLGVLRLPGSIPACAGKPAYLAVRDRLAGVHPRVCGETWRPEKSGQHGRGPSPRVRGNPLEECVDAGVDGSIPACAGKPHPEPVLHVHARVHPRVCGETLNRPPPQRKWRGPSPRVRGNRACSGSYPLANWVHPRVCGETRSASRCSTCIAGPSPRVRGNLARRALVAHRPGSIPACAGKP